MRKEYFTNGETKAFKCSYCGEISQADYARCPVCGMVMFHKLEEDDKC